jgi:hypothetical protein
MGDHFLNPLYDAGGRKRSITGNPLRDELGALDWNSNALSPVDQKDPCSLLSGSLSCARTCGTRPDDDNIVGF